VVVLLNEQDEVIYQKRLPNDLLMILGQLAPYHGELKGLVVESTYNWYWLVDGLMEASYRVHLANPAAIQQYHGLKYTDDHSDARWLAHLLRLGVLPEGYIYPKAERAVRDLLRKRTHLVRQHTANILSVQNILARNTDRAPERVLHSIGSLVPRLLCELPAVFALHRAHKPLQVGSGAQARFSARKTRTNQVDHSPEALCPLVGFLFHRPVVSHTLRHHALLLQCSEEHITR
jgi:hypothetical protein